MLARYSSSKQFSHLPYMVILWLVLTGVYLLWRETGERHFLTIGLNVELSGSQAAVGQSSLKAAQLAVKAHNKLGGTQVKLDVRDNQSDSQQATIVTQQLAISKAVAMVGPNPSQLAVAAATAAENHQLVMISPWSTTAETTLNTDTTHKQFVYRAAYVDFVQGKVLAQYALDALNTKRAAILYDQSTLVLADQAGFFHQEYAARATVTTVETFKSGEGDIKAVLQRIKNSRPEVIFLPAYTEDAVAIIKQARAMGITTPFLGSDAWGGQQIVTQCGAECEGSYLSAHFAPDKQTPATQDFVATYQAEYGQVPDDVAALTYDSIGVILLGLEKAGKAERAALAQTLTAGLTYEGVTGSLRFNPNNGDPVKNLTMVKIDQGSLKWQAELRP